MRKFDGSFTSSISTERRDSGQNAAEEVADLVSLFETSAERYGDRPMFGVKRNGERIWLTYAKIKGRVDRARTSMYSLGVGKGDRVAIISSNCVSWAVYAYAAYGLGAAVVPMYESQRPEDWEFIIRDCGAKVLYATSIEVCAKVANITGKIDHLRAVVFVGRGHDLDAGANGQQRLEIRKPVKPAPDDIATLIYTSGTTGNPKGVVLTHRNVCSNIAAVRRLFPLSEDDRSLSFLPWAHSFGHTCELHGLVSIGASIGICDDTGHLVEELAEVKPTIFFAVPTVFNKIYAGVRDQMRRRPRAIRALFARGLDASLASRRGEKIGCVRRLQLRLADRLIFAKIRAKFGGRLKFVISGGAALAREIAEFVDGLGIPVFEGYGLTETSPIVSTNCPAAVKIGTVGKPIAGVRVDIDASVLETGKEGEIVVYGPNVMKGYHERPDENAAAFTADGGFRTGDIGHVDGEGFLHITGRLKEQYKLLNGKYVVPGPLEEQLKLSPLIANAFVYGDNKPYNVAVIVPVIAELRRRLAEAGVQVPDGEKIASGEEARRALLAEIEKHSGGFRGYERIRKILVTTEDFTQENGMLTPTLKLKRRNVLKRWGAAIEALYVDPS